MRHIAIAAAAAMAALENFRPYHLDQTLLTIVFNYLPTSPYAQGEITEQPAGAPVNQIASANRNFNIAWRRIFGPYVRREIRHVIHLIVRRNHGWQGPVIMLLQVHHALGWLPHQLESPQEEEAWNSQEEDPEEEEEASNSQEEEEEPWVDVADAFDAWWRLWGDGRSMFDGPP